tara:strand:+ start:161 stop:595 length:435 start_codon:yes stop_codon:yes gene_type:complete
MATKYYGTSHLLQPFEYNRPHPQNKNFDILYEPIPFNYNDDIHGWDLKTRQFCLEFYFDRSNKYVSQQCSKLRRALKENIPMKQCIMVRAFYMYIGYNRYKRTRALTQSEFYNEHEWEEGTKIYDNIVTTKYEEYLHKKDYLID